jgi:multidrug efflux pump subunit AcrB
MRRLSLPEWCFAHPVGTLAVVAAVTFAGLLAAFRLPINLMPDIVYPMVRVHVPAGDTPPETLLQTVTRPLELELAQAEGLTLIESTTQQGQAQITISFDFDHDIDVALRDIIALVDRAKARLPADLPPPEVFKFDPQNLPVVEFTLSSSVLDPVALRRYAEEDLAYRFIGTNGVAIVRAAGGRVREVQVRVDPLKLRGLGLTLSDVADAVEAANVQRPAGRVDAANRELAGLTLSLFGSAEEIADLRVDLACGQQVRLRDFATVLDTYREQRLIVHVNGEEAVKLSVFKTLQANATEVAASIRSRLDALRAERAIPDGVNVAITADESVYIRNSMAAAQHTFVLAMALIALAVLLFLREWKFTLIGLSVLPVGLCATALLMQAFGLSLNLMSLGGWILGVTLMVDYGIVLLENMTRHWAAGADLRESVVHASREVSGALLASLAALLAAITPFLFLGGTALLFFEEFILTIMFATSAGLLAAYAVIPALWPYVSRFVRHGAAHEGALMSRFAAGYRRTLDWLPRRLHWLFVGVFGGALIATLIAPRLGYLFLPDIDDGRVTVTIDAEPGTLLEDLNDAVRRIEAFALAQEEVALVDVSTGGRVGQSVQEIPAYAEMLIELVPKTTRALSVEEWIAAFDAEVDKLDLIGMNVRAAKARIRAIRTFAGQAAFGDFDVVVRIAGQDPATLARLGEVVRDSLLRIDGLTDVTATLIPDQPLLNVTIDRERAAVFGVPPGDIADAISNAVTGKVASRLLDRSFYYDIRVLNDRDTLHGHLLDLPALPLQRLPNGDVLLLGQVAKAEFAKGPLALDRVNQVTVNMVNAAVRGRTIGEAGADVRAAMAALTLPSGYSLSFGGRMALLQEGGGDFWWSAGLALALMIVVLAVYFESVVLPLLIVGVVPLGLVGALVALWLTGTPLSSTVFIGMILLVGISANNAIVLVTYVRQLLRSGAPAWDAIRDGAAVRLRPKLMTAFVAMVGLAPLSFGHQIGGEFLQPLAITVLGGIPVSLLATLVVLPKFLALYWGAASEVVHIPKLRKSAAN